MDAPARTARAIPFPRGSRISHSAGCGKPFTPDQRTNAFYIQSPRLQNAVPFFLTDAKCVSIT